ncbi:WecB/TagA/CpsF family glycosyltransferase [Enterococcus lemanii]|uniref:WecB/TagA/CpsF family glycosyltransferase n=1 Tax=Enterococcus lemanii TaxID=1159752 RepID=A0ABV9MVI6_9ENTE|nr:WecB/TagA/CpsF family glycosyltransferase [Enterococcus lemanii]MBM7709071.1 N-acetylglucosaminyldiphosphoundecaprenol N-acetyl-beta-D-mannosaminyltransferase [Enterococcus lemanii]
MNKIFSNLINMKGEDFYKLCRENIAAQKKMFVITANPEIFIKSLSEQEITEILNSPESSIVADGIAIVQGARFLGIPIPNRITGIDLTTNLLDALHQKKGKLYLLGAASDVMEKLVQRIEEQYSGIELVGFHDGYSFDEAAVTAEILKKQPDLCLVALGVPRQEKLIHKIYPHAKKGVFIGVGGTFDVLSGTKKRAPQFFIKFRLEWLYRITKEPWRLKRFADNNLRFVGVLVKTRIQSKKDR